MFYDSSLNIKNKFQLEKGDVEFILPSFLKNNPGLRISLIYIDVDLERPTYHALKNLWDRLLPGGVIVFDEYEYHKFSESNGVDKFLKEFICYQMLKNIGFLKIKVNVKTLNKYENHGSIVYIGVTMLKVWNFDVIIETLIQRRVWV